MASSIVSYSNVHQLSSSDKMSGIDIKKKLSPTPLKMLLHQQQASPDSTNNNNNINNNNNNIPQVSTMITTPTTFTAVQQTVPAPRGRGRKTTPSYVQVIPGQPVAVARRNARERNRVKQVNNGFSTLRQHIPFSARNKKMSKVETLRCAVEYIRSLQRMLDENGGYDGGRLEGDMNLDLSHNVSSSSPVSTIESGEEDHSLMSIGNSDVMYETPTDTVPSSSTLLVDDYATSEYASQLRAGVILQSSGITTNSRLYSTDNNVVFDDSPLPAHPNSLIRHGSSLSPGYSDRSSVNNSPATEVTTTGFMGVFAAAAAGLDKNSAAGLMMDLTRSGGSIQQALIFKKERREDDEDERCRMLELEGANASEVMEALSWWELDQARRIQQQQQQASS